MFATFVQSSGDVDLRFGIVFVFAFKTNLGSERVDVVIPLFINSQQFFYILPFLWRDSRGKIFFSIMYFV